MNSLWMFVLCAWGLSVAQDACLPPPGAVKWDDNPANTVHDVIWAYGADTICHTESGCNMTSTDQDNSTLVTGDVVEPQLKPLRIQIGTVVRFAPPSTGYSAPIMPYYVDELGFRTCNTSRGSSLLPAEANESFVVSQEFLKEGSNYFIVDDSHPLEDCKSGLRINITVKSSECHPSHVAACSGRGVCVTYNDQPSYSCHCCGLYKGDNCDIFDSCLSHPCYNGGSCYHPKNDSHEFACECPFGYYGDHCENRTEDLCDVVECAHNATCSGNSTDFHCECPPGYTGSHCEVDINECEASPCAHGACVDELNGFTCHCDPGYIGDTCSQRLKPCSLSPCKNGGFCQEVQSDPDPYKFACHCQPGWAGETCRQNVSACESKPCVHGTCVEGDGKFSCVCSPGYTGSRCEVNINDCDPNPCKFGGHCRDGVNKHICICIHSHAGSNCQFTLDLFSPILEEVDSSGGIIHNPEHTKNLYIVAGALTAGVIVMLTVLIVCYCRISGSLDNCCGLSKYFWYKRHRDDLTLHVDVTSASDCPLAVDAFWKPIDSEHEALGAGNSSLSFQNHAV